MIDTSNFPELRDYATAPSTTSWSGCGRGGSSLDGMPAALTFGSADDERPRAATLAQCDVSARLARVTLKGPGAADFLAARQIAVPQEIMEALAMDWGRLDRAYRRRRVLS